MTFPSLSQKQKFIFILPIFLILLIISGAAAKIIIEKKKGAKCVGCPYSESNEDDCSCNLVSENNKN